MKELVALVRMIGAKRWALPLLVGLGVVASLAESFGIGLLIPFAHEVLGQQGFPAAGNLFIDTVNAFARLLGEENRALMLGLAIIGFVLCKAALMLVYNILSAYVREETAHSIRHRSIARLIGLDYGQFSARSPGDYHNVIAGETWRASDALAAFLNLISHGVTAAVFLILLIMLSWPLVMVAAAVFVVASLLVRLISRRAEDMGEAGVDANTQFSERALSVLAGMRTVRVFAQDDRERRTLEQSSDGIRHAFHRMHVLGGSIGPLLEAIYVPSLIGMIFLAHSLGTPGPTLIAFLVLMYRLIPHVRAVEEGRVALASAAPSVAAVTALLALPDAVRDPTRTPFKTLHREIRFADVAFGYDGGAREGFAVDGVSFVLKRGQTVALVGASGSGKSTLVNLLLGFYAPQRGEITIDGVPLSALDILSWRQKVGFAGQDSELFPGTIADNIAYGRPGIGRAAIEEAAQRADALGFIERMTQGLDTPIRREGLDLSGGQRQRIALARALLVDADVLILDEATNAVDNVTEATLQRMLRTVVKDKTTLIIAHRLSTIRHADWVIALDHGRVAEQGPPSVLLRNDAAFARLYKLEGEAAGPLAAGH